MKYPRKVYVIRHNKTNRVYIGSSSDVDRRFLNHLNALRSHRHIVEDMQKDFDECGEDLTLTVLDTINGIQENCKEYEWMRKYKSFVRGVGYNYKDRKFHGADDAKATDLTNGEQTNTKNRELTEREAEFIGYMRTIKEVNPDAYVGIQLLMISCGFGKQMQSDGKA